MKRTTKEKRQIKGRASKRETKEFPLSTSSLHERKDLPSSSAHFLLPESTSPLLPPPMNRKMQANFWTLVALV